MGQSPRAPRDYIFERPVLLGRCAWARTLHIGRAAHQRKRKVLRHRQRKSRATRSGVSSGAGSSAEKRARSAARNFAFACNSARQRHLGAIASETANQPGPASPPPQVSYQQQRLGAQVQLQLHHRLWQDHRGPSKRRDYHQCILLPGITCIFIAARVNLDSNMPSFVFSTKLAESVTRAHQTLCTYRSDAPPEGWEIVPTYDAKCLWRT